jgi:uncharacterized protein (DUF488 family)
LITYTIGFTKKSAEEFFSLVCGSGAKRLVDVRLHNVSQLAGFAKRDDLAFFLARMCGIEYVAEPRLAPEPGMLAAYRGRRISWETYAQQFLSLMARRHIEDVLEPALIDGAVLLCSEDSPDKCHRRLAAEYLARAWGDVSIQHLGQLDGVRQAKLPP